MRQPGVFYDPSVHDWGSKVVQGGLAGMAMARNAQEYEANKMKMDEAKKMQAVKDEIAAAYKEYEGTVKAPEGGMDPTQQGMIAMDQQRAIQAEGTPTGQETPAIAERVAAEGQKPQGLAGLLAEKQATQASEETKAKPLVAKAQFMTKAKEIFEKHGMVDQAMAIESNYMKHVGTIATTIGKKAAFKELKTGMLKDSFQDMTEDDIEDKGDHFKIEKVGPNNDGIVKFNKKDGTLEIVKEPTAKEEKDGTGGSTGLRHYKDKGYDVTEEYDKESKTWKEKGRTAIKDPNATGKKDEAKKEWTKADVRQEYNNVNTYLDKVEQDLAKRLENEGENTDLTVQIEKIRNVRQNLMKYRSDDEWSVSDAKSSERGKYPRNLQKISDYLSNFGAAAQNKDITNMKPKAGRKSLDDIL